MRFSCYISSEPALMADDKRLQRRAYLVLLNSIVYALFMFWWLHLSDEWIQKNLPTVFLNWFLATLITLEIGGLISSKSQSLSWFDSYSFWIYLRAACERHQTQTIRVCLFSSEFRISMPSSFSWAMSLKVLCDLGFILFWRAAIFSWRSCVSVGVIQFTRWICTLSFITPKPKTKFECKTTYSDTINDCTMKWKYYIRCRLVTNITFPLK